MPRSTSLRLAIALVLCAAPLAAQEAAPPAGGGLHLTVFRSPATGLEYRRGAFAAHAGYYPTILKADGQAEGENTNFIRAGVAAYLRPRGWSPFIAPALLVSLDDDWESGVITEIGARVPVAGRLALRGGVGILTAFDGEVRANPTIGFDIRLGGR